MFKIYEDANDQHVRNIVVYGDTASGKLYHEADHLTQVTKEFLSDAFNKHMLMVINTAGDKLYPVALTKNTVSTVTVSDGEVTGIVWSALAE